MKRATFLVAAGLACLASCGRHSGPASGPGQSATSAPTGGAPPPPPAYIAATARDAPAQNVSGAVHPFLTEQLRLFIRDHGRLPASFTELARARLDSVPRPPEGRKWVIDAATREVKAVPAR